MASHILFRKGSGLMFLSMGVLVLLVGTFFVVNGNFNPAVGAHKRTTFTGVLRKDPGHKFPCNLSVKADYVLQNPTDSGNCIPIVANPSEANPNVDHVVEVNGASNSAEYFATSFRTISDSGTLLPTPAGTAGPGYNYHPKGVTGTSTPSYTGPATRNPY